VFDLDFRDSDTHQPPGDGPARWVEIHGLIDREMAEEVVQDIERHEDARALYLDIASPGGSITAALNIYAAVRNHRAVQKAAYISLAESAAVLIAMAADRRSLLPGGQMLLHGVQQVPLGRWTAAEHERAARDCRWWDAQLADVFSYRSGKQAKVFLEAMQDERSAPIEWLLANNVITELKDNDANPSLSLPPIYR